MQYLNIDLFYIYILKKKKQLYIIEENNIYIYMLSIKKLYILNINLLVFKF